MSPSRPGCTCRPPRAATSWAAARRTRPNADAAHVVATFWLQTLAGDTEPKRLRYSQTVLLNFNGLGWPHITVATLTKP